MANPAGLYLAGPGGKFDLTDPRTSEMVKQISADPNKAPQYGVSLAEVFALQNMLKRFQQQSPQVPQTTVVQDLKNQLQQARQLPPEETGIGALPSNNFQPENFANGGIVAFAQGSKDAIGSDIIDPTAMEETIQGPVNPNYLRNYSRRVMRGADYIPSAERKEEYTRQAAPALLAAATAPLALPYLTAAAPSAAMMSPGITVPSAITARGITTLSPTLSGLAKSLGITGTASGIGEAMAGLSSLFKGPSKEEVGAQRIQEHLTSQPGFDVPEVENGITAGTTAPTAKPSSVIAKGTGTAATPEARAKAAAAAKQTTVAGATTAPAVAESDGEGMKMLRAAKTEREKLVEEAKPKSREDYKKELEDEYKKAGIGGADAKRVAQLAEREGKLEAEHDKRMWLDASKAGFKMAAAASKRGATFLGSAAAGGEEFADAYGKTMDAIEAKRTKLADAKYDLDKLEEARKMGIIDKTDSRYKEAKSDYAKARHDLLTLQEKSAEMVYGRESAEKLHRMDAATRLQVARLAQAGHYNLMQDLMGRLDKADPAEREKILNNVKDIYKAQFKDSSVQAAEIRQAQILAKSEIDGLKINPDYIKASPAGKQKMIADIYARHGIESQTDTGDASTAGWGKATVKSGR